MQIVQVATEAELALALRLRRRVFIEEQAVPEEEEVDDYDRLDSSARHLLVLDDDGQVLGTGRFIPYGNQAKLQRICVSDQARGRGIGQVLMTGLEDWARQEGFAAAVLGAQIQAQAFYEKLGYTPMDSPLYWDAGIQHQDMHKPLT